MNENNHIRRRADRSVDLGFYRTSAVMLRRQEMREPSALRAAVGGALATLGTLAVIAMAAAGS